MKGLRALVFIVVLSLIFNSSPPLGILLVVVTACTVFLLTTERHT